MRILHVIPSVDPEGGGPIQALRGLAIAQKNLDSAPQVAVIATYRGGEDFAVVEALEGAGVEVTTIGPTRGPLRTHPDLKRAVETAVAKAGIVHIHSVWEQIQHLAAVSSRRLRRPHIFRPCGMLDPWCLNQGRLKKKLYIAWRLRRNLNACSAMHFTTETERRLVEPLGFRCPAIVEPNGVDLAEFESLPQRGGFRRRHESIGERPLVLFLSRVHHKKGLDLLVPAFARVRNKDAVLAIAGPAQDGYDETVRKMAREHGVGERVILTGMLRGGERIEALVDADLFVLPSYQENFGVAVVEAMAAGTPVVISDQVNIFREVEEAGAGEAAPTRVEPLAGAIERWLEDQPRRLEAGKRGAKFVREHYDWRRIAERWMEHYEMMYKSTSPQVQKSTDRARSRGS